MVISLDNHFEYQDLYPPQKLLEVLDEQETLRVERRLSSLLEISLVRHDLADECRYDPRCSLDETET